LQSQVKNEENGATDFKQEYENISETSISTPILKLEDDLKIKSGHILEEYNAQGINLDQTIQEMDMKPVKSEGSLYEMDVDTAWRRVKEIKLKMKELFSERERFMKKKQSANSIRKIEIIERKIKSLDENFTHIEEAFGTNKHTPG